VILHVAVLVDHQLVTDGRTDTGPWLVPPMHRTVKKGHLTLTTFPSPSQWRNDGVAAVSSDGGPTGGRGPPTVLEFLVINFSVCLVLLSNCYVIIYCIIWFQIQPLMIVLQ